jgi:hypothetical protein
MVTMTGPKGRFRNIGNHSAHEWVSGKPTRTMSHWYDAEMVAWTMGRHARATDLIAER